MATFNFGSVYININHRAYHEVRKKQNRWKYIDVNLKRGPRYLKHYLCLFAIQMDTFNYMYVYHRNQDYY